MRFDVLLGDLIGAILAPIFEAIFGFLAAVFTFLGELLAPVFAPILAPIVEVLVAAYLLVLGTFYALVWSLISALGLVRYARGVSFIGYTLAALSLTYLLICFLQGVGVLGQSLPALATDSAVIGALVLTVLGFLFGAGAAMSPEERHARRERRRSRKPQSQAGPVATKDRSRWPGALVLLVLIAGIGLGWLWASRPTVADLPDCETEDRLRDVAAEWLKTRGRDKTADMVAPRDCID